MPQILHAQKWDLLVTASFCYPKKFVKQRCARMLGMQGDCLRIYSHVGLVRV